MFSGGAGSWAAAKRVVARHGASEVVLLFADTRMEDEDLYRFLAEAAVNIGAKLVRTAEGRTPWEVFRDERFLGNTRVDPCSKILKRQWLDRWLEENRTREDTVVHVGIDWSEEHRFTKLRDRRAESGWRYEAPLCDEPYLTKKQILTWMAAEGVRPPRLYEMGFPHNNCGGFCIKAGQAQWALLLKAMPERYAFHEKKEEELRGLLGDVSILRDRRGGKNRPLPLAAFRKRVETGDYVDRHEWGGCGCFVDRTDEAGKDQGE